LFRQNFSSLLDVKTLTRLAEISLAFEVLNAVTAPNTHPEVVLEAAVDVE